MPVLYLAATHDESWAPHAVDQKRRLAGWYRRVRRVNAAVVGHLRKRFEHARVVEDRSLKHEHPLRRGGNLWDLIDRTLDQHHPGHSTSYLHRGRAVQMRVIPVSTRWMVGANRVLMLPHGSGLDPHRRVIHHEVAINQWV